MVYYYAIYLAASKCFLIFSGRNIHYRESTYTSQIRFSISLIWSITLQLDSQRITLINVSG